MFLKSHTMNFKAPLELHGTINPYLFSCIQET